jgi:hypothetical protein
MDPFTKSTLMTETEQISGASALNSTLALLVTRDIFSEV